jgi:carbon monoxide dehydrogenase subunit G
MDLNASYTFDAPAERVWAVLLDTSIVGHCLPGSRGLRPLGDDRYEVELAVAVSAISGDFKGTVTLADQDPPRSYRLVVDGAGRPGFVKGQALVTLVPQDAQTVVQIAAHADVGGMIARVGQRLLDGVARMTMDRFFGCLAKQL